MPETELSSVELLNLAKTDLKKFQALVLEEPAILQREEVAIGGHGYQFIDDLGNEGVLTEMGDFFVEHPKVLLEEIPFDDTCTLGHALANGCCEYIAGAISKSPELSAYYRQNILALDAYGKTQTGLGLEGVDDEVLEEVTKRAAPLKNLLASQNRLKESEMHALKLIVAAAGINVEGFIK